MATSKVEAKAKTGSPANTITAPKGGGTTVRAANAARPGNTPMTVNAIGQSILRGPSPELVASQQAARTGVESALTGLESVGTYTPGEYGGKVPVFDRKAVAKAMPMLTVMMALGGRATRGNALGMMKAMTAGIRGLQQGNEDAYKQALTDYENNYQEFLRREEARKKVYDLKKDAAKDGLAIATSRMQMADAAVKDERDTGKDRLDVALTLEKNNRDLRDFNARMGLVAAQTAAARARAAQTAAAGQQPTNLAGLAPKDVQKRNAAHGKATLGLSGALADYDNQIIAVQKLLQHPGLKDITGKVVGKLPVALTDIGSEALAIYDNLIARGTFRSLTELRAASPTGGALGNVSDRDIQTLRDSVGAIQRSQTAEGLQNNLREYAQSLKDSRNRVVDAYNSDYEYDPSLQARVATPQDVEVTARQNGITIQEAIKRLEAAGYRVLR